MKPFDLEAAKRGEPIVTRDGRKAAYVGYAPKANEPYRLVVHIEGDGAPTSYHDAGTLWRTEPHCVDLFMGTRKRTVYVNLWPMSRCYGNAIWYDSVDEARNTNTGAIATAVPIEIED